MKTTATDVQDFGYELDLAGITDANNNPITDSTELAALIDDITSSDETVIALVPATDGVGKGVAHPTGKAGTSTISGKVYASQADKDAGKDPIFIANEVWDVLTGPVAKVSSGVFKFTPTEPPPAPQG